jgi:hypothetical protein
LVLVDTLLFTLMFARLNGAGVPLRDVLGGGILAAIGFSGMKIFGSELLKGASHSRFLATFGVVVGLLIWMNIAARLVLVAAAWSATVAYDRGHLRTPEPVELRRARSAARDGAGVAQAVPTGEPVEEQPARTAERSRRRSPLLLVLAFAAAALARRSVRTRRRISDRPAPSAGNAPGAVLPDGSRESPSPVSPAGGRQPRRRER